MSIKIRKAGQRYLAQLTLPDMPAVDSEWSTSEPMDRDQLIEELRQRGAHPTDIGDAFYSADPDWLEK